MMIRTEGNQVCQFVFPAFADGRNVMNVNERIPTAYHALALKMPSIHVLGVSSVPVVLVVRILCAGNVLFPWRVYAISGTKDALARAVFPLVDQVRLDVERFAASLANNRNAPNVFLFLGFLEQRRPRLIGAIPAAKVPGGLDVLIAFLHERLAAMLALDFNILRSRIPFGMVNAVLLVAINGAESIAAFVSASAVNLAARFAGNHRRFDSPMFLGVCQSALIGTIELLAFGQRFVAVLAIHCFYLCLRYGLITNYTTP